MINPDKLLKGSKILSANLIGIIFDKYYFDCIVFENGFSNRKQVVLAKSVDAVNRYKNKADFLKAYNGEDQNYVNENFEFIDESGLRYLHKYSACEKSRIIRNFKLLENKSRLLKKWKKKGSLFETNSILAAFDLSFEMLAAQGAKFFASRIFFHLLKLRLKWLAKPILILFYFVSDNFAISFIKFKDYRTKLLNFRELENDEGLSDFLSKRMGAKSREEQLEIAKMELDKALTAYIEMNKVAIGLTISIITILISVGVSYVEFISKRDELTKILKKNEDLETINVQKEKIINELTLKVLRLESPAK